MEMTMTQGEKAATGKETGVVEGGDCRMRLGGAGG
jgi:hypothetical protein